MTATRGPNICFFCVWALVGFGASGVAEGVWGGSGGSGGLGGCEALRGPQLKKFEQASSRMKGFVLLLLLRVSGCMCYQVRTIRTFGLPGWVMGSLIIPWVSCQHRQNP